MKVEEIKLALEKNKETHLQFKDVKTVTKSFDKANTLYGKALDNRVKAQNMLKSVIQNYNLAKVEYETALSNINKLKDSAKSLGVDLPANISNMEKSSNDDLSRIKTNINALNSAISSIDK